MHFTITLPHVFLIINGLTNKEFISRISSRFLNVSDFFNLIYVLKKNSIKILKEYGNILEKLSFTDKENVPDKFIVLVNKLIYCIFRFQHM